MSLKQAAEELLKIADDMENEADKVTKFVCADCNHTATLETINQRRKEAAEKSGKSVSVSKITVNDRVTCAACGGTMEYYPTEESQAYYFEPKQAKSKKTEEGEEEVDASEPIDYDSLERYAKKSE